MKRLMDLRIVQTSEACPEQYDVFFGASQVQVGYLRLRHGHFTVRCPDVTGKIIYEACPDGDGEFMDIERSRYLGTALLEIWEWVKLYDIPEKVAK